MMDLEWSHKRHAAIFVGAQQYALEHGWHTVIDEFADEELPVRPTRSMPYDGIIARATQKLADRARRLHLPVVNVWFGSPAWNVLPGVFPDFAAGGRLVAEHLLSRGLRRFAVLRRADRAVASQAAAFRQVVQAAGCSCVVANYPVHLSRCYSQWRQFQERIEAWMSSWQPPMGVFAATEEVGRTIVQMCHRRGWRVPQDVAIVAGNNELTLCEHPRPSLSSVERGYEKVGYEAARLLDGLIDARQARAGRSSPKAAQPLHIYLPPVDVVVRESTDAIAANDKLVAAAMQFISKNCHRSINREDVARAVFAETRTLQNHFHKRLGRPIAAEIRRVRIERAKRELADSNRSLAEIALDSGFGSATRLHQVFRRELGITPGQYRRQWLGAQES